MTCLGNKKNIKVAARKKVIIVSRVFLDIIHLPRNTVEWSVS